MFITSAKSLKDWQILHLKKKKEGEIKGSYFAFPGKRGNVMFAVMPSTLGVLEKEGGDGVSFDHVWDNFKPVQAKVRNKLTPTLKMKTE